MQPSMAGGTQNVLAGCRRGCGGDGPGGDGGGGVSAQQESVNPGSGANGTEDEALD
jgi:hypothetical protein